NHGSRGVCYRCPHFLGRNRPLTLVCKKKSCLEQTLVMALPLEVFDYVQTILFSVLLVLTIPIASFVYAKLLFIQPFSKSFTYKLIAVNGIVTLLYCLAYIIIYQMSSFKFLYGLYKSIEDLQLVKPLSLITPFFQSLSVNSALFVSLHRVKKFSPWSESSDQVFYFIALIFSVILSLPTLADFSFFTTMYYKESDHGSSTELSPSSTVTNEISRLFTSAM
ncbi:hypothetical protein PMAYCL1PPCAC_30871, partial [Pristionchus mayeri]